MQYLIVLQLLILLALANGSPIIAKWTFGNYCSWPLDGNIRFIEGRPLFGTSKTIRGILVLIFITSACAPLIGFTLRICLLVATTAIYILGRNRIRTTASGFSSASGQS
jgi:CDP-2,3-bis-(O-geranylgeranyl)-sn-glycerol synthase